MTTFEMDAKLALVVSAVVVVVAFEGSDADTFAKAFRTYTVRPEDWTAETSLEAHT